jgi:hypothetical protein
MTVWMPGTIPNSSRALFLVIHRYRVHEMSRWGSGSFENDDALSFVAQLNGTEPESLKQILSRAADESDYVAADEGSRVIAAAEVVAAAKGSPSLTIPTEISQWISKIDGTPSANMQDLARRAVNRVRLNSELKDLWLESDGLNEWSAVLRDLEDRLAAQNSAAN